MRKTLGVTGREGHVSSTSLRNSHDCQAEFTDLELLRTVSHLVYSHGHMWLTVSVLAWPDYLALWEARLTQMLQKQSQKNASILSRYHGIFFLSMSLWPRVGLHSWFQFMTCHSSDSIWAITCIPFLFTLDTQKMPINYVFRNIEKETVFGEYLGTSKGTKEQSYYRSGSMA